MQFYWSRNSDSRHHLRLTMTPRRAAPPPCRAQSRRLLPVLALAALCLLASAEGWATPRAFLRAGPTTRPDGPVGEATLPAATSPALMSLPGSAPERAPGPERALLDSFELGCATQPPDSLLGIQANYFGGDCLPGPPFTPGNLVGFAFPLENDVEDGQVVGIRIFFRNLEEPELTANLYLWEETAGLPNDACGSELFKWIEAPIQSDTAYSSYSVTVPVPLELGERIWLGVVYPFTAPAIPNWFIGSIAGPSQEGRSFVNTTGDHADWFDLDFFGWGLCYNVHLVLEPSGANLPPVANAGGPYCGSSELPVLFDGTGSFDPNGDTITYAWDFGDGATGSGATPSHLYAPGSAVYTVNLVVADAVTADTTATRLGLDIPPTIRVPDDLDLETAIAMGTVCAVDSILVGPGAYAGPFSMSGTDLVMLATGGPLVTELMTLRAAQPVLSILDGAPTIRGFSLTGGREGIIATGPVRIEDCRLVDCGRTGILISASAPATIHSCVVAHNSVGAAGGGVDLRGAHVLSQSTVDGNGVFGVRTSPFLGSETATITHTSITNTQHGGGLQCVGTTPDVACTNIWNNTLNNNCGNDLGGNFAEDPLYCDPLANDYNVHSDSPLLGVSGCGRVGYGVDGCGLAASIVSGAVANAIELPLAGMIVVAFDVLTGEQAGTDTTNESGTYSIGGLTAGGYRVEVLPSGTFFMGEHYDDVPSHIPSNVGQAETLWLVTPQLRDGTDFRLTLGGTFSGLAADAVSGDPLSSVPIVPFEIGRDTLRATYSAMDGTYTSVPLPAATYGAMTPGVGGYVGEYYLDAALPGDADPFTVTLVTDTPGIGFTLDRSLIGIDLEELPPVTLALGEPVPNPFNPSTVIPLTVPAPAAFKLRVYDVQGRLVRTLIDGPVAAGHHRLRWDGRAASGAALASGIYLIRLEGDAAHLTRRVVLLR